MEINQRPIHERRFVRVTGRHDGFVEFDFSIGGPELYIELILSEAAFEEFCRDNRVETMSQQDAEQIDRYRDAWVSKVTPDQTTEQTN